MEKQSILDSRRSESDDSEGSYSEWDGSDSDHSVPASSDNLYLKG